MGPGSVNRIPHHTTPEAAWYLVDLLVVARCQEPLVLQTRPNPPQHKHLGEMGAVGRPAEAAADQSGKDSARGISCQSD
jgi:hypothetical protein